MLGQHFGRAFHIPGAPMADLDIRISVPVDCRLARVSVVGSNANDGTIDIGTSDDTDEILAGAAFGDSDVPAAYDRDDFESTNPTGRLEKGDVLVITVDLDGGGATGVQDLTIDLDFIEG